MLLLLHKRLGLSKVFSLRYTNDAPIISGVGWEVSMERCANNRLDFYCPASPKNIIVTQTVFIIGPYFVSFPNLREALNNRVPIQTQARACTILPNFVGYVCLPEFVRGR